MERNTRKTPLDKKDVALIQELIGDSKLSEAKLARKTGIPMTTVHNRLGKLRGLGVIRGYTIRLDYAKLGRPLSAYVLIKAAAGADQRSLLGRVSSLGQVSEAALIAGGEYDIVSRVRVESVGELNELLISGIKADKAVSDARALISVEAVER